MGRVAAAVGLMVALTLAAPAGAARSLTGNQALKSVQAVIAKSQASCALTWKRMTANALTMDGHSWRVTVTGVVTNKGSGKAIWTVSTKTTPANTLATAISSGCA